MKLRADFHTHTTYCDGKSTPRQMVEAAYRMGLTDLGIVLPREFQWPFTLYLFYLLGYIVQGILLSLFIVLKMKKIKMYECLREE